MGNTIASGDSNNYTITTDKNTYNIYPTNRIAAIPTDETIKSICSSRFGCNLVNPVDITSTSPNGTSTSMYDYILTISSVGNDVFDGRYNSFPLNLNGGNFVLYYKIIHKGTK